MGWLGLCLLVLWALSVREYFLQFAVLVSAGFFGYTTVAVLVLFRYGPSVAFLSFSHVPPRNALVTLRKCSNITFGPYAEAGCCRSDAMKLCKCDVRMSNDDLYIAQVMYNSLGANVFCHPSFLFSSSRTSTPNSSSIHLIR